MRSPSPSLPSRRDAIAGAAGGAVLLANWPASAAEPAALDVPPELQRRMYAAALDSAKRHVRGGEPGSAYRRRFVDAAFSSHIFLWDTCFIAAYAKYHPEELPIRPALDNFYERQEADGFICREYDAQGRPFWPKDHPVSINPPLLAFAELELFTRTRDVDRLAGVYPKLARFYDFIAARYRCDDGLFFSDALGSGMDNIPRYPDGWRDDGRGLPLHNLYPQVFNYDLLSSKWNRQGRSVDFSAQMALFADQLAQIAHIVGRKRDIARWRAGHADIARAINAHCWSEADGFYYDLGYGEPIRRKHIGMFWTLLAGVAPPARTRRMIAHLMDPAEFWRRIPAPAWPADQVGFSPGGDYWMGGVWAPTNYMLLRGLRRCGAEATARGLARAYYWAVAQVFEATGTFWENYSPDSLAPGRIARPDFCGWTALAPIAVLREFIAD
ncbi:MAG TPA: trehalase family glycosidase [Caulobacteraceae bacterium]|nr:trehalase family glycosidase [Caulobacteraceae bacterium]